MNFTRPQQAVSLNCQFRQLGQTNLCCVRADSCDRIDHVTHSHLVELTASDIEARVAQWENREHWKAAATAARAAFKAVSEGDNHSSRTLVERLIIDEKAWPQLATNSTEPGRSNWEQLVEQRATWKVLTERLTDPFSRLNLEDHLRTVYRLTQGAASDVDNAVRRSFLGTLFILCSVTIG